ncbi:membrane integrity-associated transporter subunit PqiC [Pseudomonas sp. ABC1]|uniref:ABC-type transport auxiliary lipoprotein family protein n=1 Tax=Pseudomonas sp. ABC1 TaxID=2748080 RepID=UPI0015C3CD7B|nr:ABC-type transport auxiliary lipoprotein family protein [Pseudomonas sp. ABC1]QLF93626.1 membrane integrity-associated transporter subunit PqiC [Pseudomonas sp. ABC1]
MKAFLPGLILVATLLSACSVLPDAEPISLYVLPESTLDGGSRQAPLKQALRVATPEANRLLSSARIAVVPQDNQVSAYQGARWADAVPTLLRDRLVENLQRDGRFPVVSHEDAGLHTDLELVSDLRAFQSEYVDGKPQVRIRLDAHLVQASNQRILATRQFEVRQPSEGKRLDAVVVSFGEASDALSRQLLDWLYEQARLNGKP